MSDDPPLDPVLLRSFLAVAETLQFTTAARRLGLSQSTVSQHIARLELAVSRPLLLRNSRGAELTADGSALVGLARDILAAHDRALAYFERGTLRGRLRFGVSEDLVLSRLPDILRRFRASHPLVDLELEVGLSSALAAGLEAGQLDLVFAKRRGDDPRGLTIWRERLLWLGSADWRPPPDRPVPLVLFSGTSITRRAAIEAFGRRSHAWHVAFTSHSLSALSAAVLAGFGISAQSSLLLGHGLVALPDRLGLPALPEIEFIVQGRGDPLPGAAAALLEAIRLDADLLRPSAQPGPS